MMSDSPKVAHFAAGRSLIEWVLRSIEPIDVATTIVVVGHGASEVSPLLPSDVIVVLQEDQLGTGHATRIGLEALDEVSSDDVVVILYGDVPLLTNELIERLVSLDPGETARLVTSTVDDPTGYGRIIRDSEGHVIGVVEENDCDDEQRAIHEINAGLYAVRAGELSAAIEMVTNDNAQGEYYLTDVVGILADKGDRLHAVDASAEEVGGINTQKQLAEARIALQKRTNQRLLEAGVWMLDPERTYIDDTVSVASGARIYPGVHLEGDTTIGPNAQVGPDSFVVDSVVGEGSTVWYSVLRSAQVGADCEVGPYASLRPGTILGDGVKVGTFVETKNTTFAEGAKAPHLSYLGDATIGARSNIGAGAITCNYDGTDKYPTEIGEDAFIGSDTMLVAPVRIGDRAVTGAGSVITNDVPDDALAVERSSQKEIPDYSQRSQERKAAEKG